MLTEIIVVLKLSAAWVNVSKMALGVSHVIDLNREIPLSLMALRFLRGDHSYGAVRIYSFPPLSVLCSAAKMHEAGDAEGMCLPLMG